MHHFSRLSRVIPHGGTKVSLAVYESGKSTEGSCNLGKIVLVVDLAGVSGATAAVLIGLEGIDGLVRFCKERLGQGAFRGRAFACSQSALRCAVSTNYCPMRDEGATPGVAR